MNEYRLLTNHKYHPEYYDISEVMDLLIAHGHTYISASEWVERYEYGAFITSEIDSSVKFGFVKI